MSTILPQSEINLIIAEVTKIIEDDNISTDIFYHLSGSTVAQWSPTTQLIPDMYSVSGVSAFKGSFKPREIDESGGLIELTDVKFIIMSSEVSGVLSTDDRIFEEASIYQSATTYEIRDINRDPLSICYFIQARAIT